MSQPAIRRCRNWKRPVDLDAVGSATASLHSLVALHSPLGDSGVCGRHFACFGRLRDPTGSGMRRLRVGKFRISSAAFASHHAQHCRPLVPIARKYSWDYPPATDRRTTWPRAGGPLRNRASPRSTGTSVDSCRWRATAGSRVALLSKVIGAGSGTALVRQELVLRPALLHHSSARRKS